MFPIAPFFANSNGYYTSQDGSVGPDSLTPSDSSTIVPLPGLEAIFEELLQEYGYGFIIAQLIKSVQVLH